ncbi:MAG TPA: glycosyltransferase family 2 protein [Vicinamibacteria bacterium]|nr:glycosyltransferase family 2 protein [Vicinamibacteria bacterium]
MSPQDAGPRAGGSQSRSAKKPSLSVVIVSWNASRYTERCLASLIDHAPARPYEVLVVDNGSADGSGEVARRFGPPVRVFELSHNQGFAAASNEGFRNSGNEYVLFLNSDIEVGETALENLCRFMDEHPEAAAAGGKLLGSDGQPQRGFNVRTFPTMMSTVFEVLMVDKLFPRNPVTRRHRMLDFSFSETAEVDQLAGACLLVRRDAFEAVGLFDEAFFPAWFEDVDLCRRLRVGGFRCFFVPGAAFLHRGGVSLDHLEYGQFLEIWYRNLVRFFDKHHGVAASRLLRGLIRLGMLERMTALVIKAPRRGMRRAEALAAYWRVLRESF